MADELTVTIAFTLSQHRQVVPQARPDGWEHCSCGWRGVALAAHQAEAVRAALGETTTEWGRISRTDFADGRPPLPPPDPSEFEKWRARRYLIVSRTVTPWVEVPRG